MSSPGQLVGVGWCVVAVAEAGTLGDCGHQHRTKMAAVRCRWAPPEYHRLDQCDLLVVRRGAR